MDLQREKYKSSHPTKEVETFGPTICIGHLDENGQFNTDWEDRMNYADHVNSGYSNFNLGKNARNGTGLKPDGEGY